VTPRLRWCLRCEKKTAQTVFAIVSEWNSVSKEQSLKCKETMMGDLRMRCAGRPDEMVVRIDNTARPQHEPKVVLKVMRPIQGATRP
jgi:hypothetical protein